MTIAWLIFVVVVVCLVYAGGFAVGYWCGVAEGETRRDKQNIAQWKKELDRLTKGRRL